MQGVSTELTSLHTLPLVEAVDEIVERPVTAPSCAVLVLSGSSGRVERERVRLLAHHGVVAMSIRWFGGPGQPPGICEVPLETFQPAVDFLAGEHERVAVIGTSKGAEAALLLAAYDPRICVVVGLAPSSVVWANVGPGLDGSAYPYRSSWTRRGTPLPFVTYDESWQPDTEPPAYRELYQRSLRAFAEQARDAAIPVERITGEVLVAAGLDDQVWPSDRFVDDIVRRRPDHGLATTSITQHGAGHTIRFPGETVDATGTVMARGGSPSSDAKLGEQVWKQLRHTLDLR